MRNLAVSRLTSDGRAFSVDFALAVASEAPALHVREEVEREREAKAGNNCPASGFLP